MFINFTENNGNQIIDHEGISMNNFTERKISVILKFEKIS